MLIPNHVAVLVPSVKKAAEYLKQFHFDIGPEEEWDSEGTKEIYVQCGAPNSLLLVEAIKDGPYKSALNKRGPGIHHYAIDVLDLEMYIESITSSGWHLHPVSLKTIKQSKTAWLTRAGFPGLIEVHEKKKLNEGSFFIEKISLNLNSDHLKLLPAVGLDAIIHSGAENEFIIRNHKIKLSSLWA